LRSRRRVRELREVASKRSKECLRASSPSTVRMPDVNPTRGVSPLGAQQFPGRPTALFSADRFRRCGSCAPLSRHYPLDDPTFFPRFKRCFSRAISESSSDSRCQFDEWLSTANTFRNHDRRDSSGRLPSWIRREHAVFIHRQDLSIVRWRFPVLSRSVPTSFRHFNMAAILLSLRRPVIS
jgi:hypothetical protein